MVIDDQVSANLVAVRHQDPTGNNGSLGHETGNPSARRITRERVVVMMSSPRARLSWASPVPPILRSCRVFVYKTHARVAEHAGGVVHALAITAILYEQFQTERNVESLANECEALCRTTLFC
jgi:hypothetical protein